MSLLLLPIAMSLRDLIIPPEVLFNCTRLLKVFPPSLLVLITGLSFLVSLVHQVTATLLPDIDAIRFGVSGQVMELAERFRMQVATLNCDKGAVPKSSPQFVGTGIASSPVPREAVEGSDIRKGFWTVRLANLNVS